MSRRRLQRFVLFAAMAFAPLLAQAQGVLEIPGPNSHQSGIGVISGWHCTGRRIELMIDNGPLILVSSSTPRDDTLAVCGRSDTGFAMSFNWGVLPPDCFGCGIHRVRAFADGVLFATSEFSVAYLGAEYLTGKSGYFVLRNFPDAGRYTSVQWDEQKQNFSVIEVGPPANLTFFGPFVGALQTGATHPECFWPFMQPRPLRYGKFSVSMNNGAMGLKAEYADGGTCELPAAPMTLSNGFVRAEFSAAQTAACPEFPGGLSVWTSVERLSAETKDSCRTGQLRASALNH